MQNQAEVYISICIPTYKRTEYIKESLQSALSQDYDHFEIIISDDSSHDEIRDIAGSFQSSKVHYVKNNPPLGLIPKLNWFLDKAQGEWVVILCDDDRLEPGYLKTLASHIARHPEASLARSRYRLIDHEGTMKRLDPQNPPVMDPFEATSKVFLPYRQTYAMNITGILFKKEILKRSGGFLNLYDGLYVDRLAWAVIGAEGLTLFENEPLCSIRIHSGSISGGFKGDYEKRVAAALEMKKFSTGLIESLAKKASTPRDKGLIEKTEKNLAECVRSGLQASFDKGFRVALSEPGNSWQKSRLIFSKMKELEIPLFRSAYLYGIIALLPFALRRFVMEQVQGTKLANFNTYLKEK